LVPGQFSLGASYSFLTLFIVIHDYVQSSSSFKRSLAPLIGTLEEFADLTFVDGPSDLSYKYQEQTVNPWWIIDDKLEFSAESDGSERWKEVVSILT
jgi:hypothetical protein